MQNLKDIQDKIFFETKTILDGISKINSVDELLAKHDLFTEVTDRIAFLRILEKNEHSFAEIFENITKQSVPEDYFSTENTPQEEVLFTTKLNELDQEPVSPVVETAQHLLAGHEVQQEPDNQSVNESVDNEVVPVMSEDEEMQRRIKDNQPLSTDTPQQRAEKKFRLASIKGLKSHRQSENPTKMADDFSERNTPTAGSILKSNIPVDYMEAEKRKPEFRLDLNDKVAFTKILFGGNESELKRVTDRLNEFQNIEEAKQYLSEIYYERDWNKVDEYAQRLWALVENKFL